MGGKRKQKMPSPVYYFRGLPEPNRVVSAYYSEKGPPLVKSFERRTSTSVRSQRVVGRMNKAFGRLYRITEEKISGGRHDTYYDLNRATVYHEQMVRLKGEGIRPWIAEQGSSMNFNGRDVKLLTILDIGCGTGKLMRRTIRTPTIMMNLEQGDLNIRLLGVDFNEHGLEVAAKKAAILFEHHPLLKGNLELELLYLDLIDLDKLDLARTCIKEEKVDIVFASDVFRWIRAEERAALFTAVRDKMKDSGYLISFEFVTPPLNHRNYLSHDIAMNLADFSFLEPMQLGDLYKHAEAAGFERILETYGNHHEELEFRDRFPMLASQVFKLKG
jgi:SAM-dependent methyltransferase